MSLLRILRPAAMALMVALPLTAGAEWLSEVEITHDPVKKGECEFTVRIMPSKTHQCEALLEVEETVCAWMRKV